MKEPSPGSVSVTSTALAVVAPLLATLIEYSNSWLGKAPGGPVCAMESWVAVGCGQRYSVLVGAGRFWLIWNGPREMPTSEPATRFKEQLPSRAAVKASAGFASRCTSARAATPTAKRICGPTDSVPAPLAVTLALALAPEML